MILLILYCNVWIVVSSIPSVTRHLTEEKDVELHDQEAATPLGNRLHLRNNHHRYHVSNHHNHSHHGIWRQYRNRTMSSSLLSTIPTPILGPYAHDSRKIAFLFLCKRHLPLELLWKEFFSYNAHPNHYNIYVHSAKIDFDFPPTSFFHGKMVKQRIAAGWGNMAVVQAIRLLVKQAVEDDPRNEYFVLLSESCIPIVAFSKWRRITLANNKSVINACVHTSPGEMEITRWRPELSASKTMDPKYWRKGATWFNLIRKHAEVFANFTEDDALWSKFQAVDEHYLPSILAMHGFDNETTCSDGVTYTKWVGNTASHPQEFLAVDPNLMTEFQYSRTYKKPALNSTLDPSGVHREITEVGDPIRIGFSCRCSGYDGICHFAARKFSRQSIFPLLDRISFILGDDDFPEVVHPGYDWESNLQPLLRKSKKATSEITTPGGERNNTSDPYEYDYFLIHSTFLRSIPDIMTIEKLLRLKKPLLTIERINKKENIQVTKEGEIFLQNIPILSEEERGMYPRYPGYDFCSFRDHQAVKDPKDPTVFYVKDSVKRMVPNPDVLYALNLTFRDIRIIYRENLQEIPEREPLK